MRKGIHLLFAVSVATFSGALLAQTPPSRIELPSVAASKPPKIDGVLDDACWTTATRVSDFYLQTEEVSTEKTDAYISYDQRSIYVAYYCHDAHPETIRHEQRRRRGSMGSDDRVELNLDTFNSLQSGKCSKFIVSAGGCQSETMPTGSVSKTEWRGDWYAATKQVDDGYIVEIEIPWTILQYTNTTGNLGIMFNRWKASTDKDHSSPKMGVNKDPFRWYIWKGLQMPKSVRRPMVMPFVLMHTSQDDSSVKGGVDMRYDPNSQSTAVLSILPDFSSVEQAVESVSFSYNEQQQGDNRPFFQEGGGYFPGPDMLYTRRLGDIDIGAKYFSRVGALSYGLMHVTAANGDAAQALTVKNEFGNKGNINIAAMQTDYLGNSGTVATLGGSIKLFQKDARLWNMYGQVGQADNGLGMGTGKRYDTGMDWSAGPRKLGASIGYSSIDDNYRPAMGYVPEFGIDTKNIGLFIYDEPSNNLVNFWKLECGEGESYFQTGELFQRNWRLNFNATTLSGYSISLNTGGGKRPPHQDRISALAVGWGHNTLFRGGGANITFGKMASGNYTNWSIGQGWNLGPSLNMNLNYTSSKLEEPSPAAFKVTQMVASFAYEFPTVTSERTIIGRFVNQENSTNFYLAYRQSSRHGMDIYVTLGDPNAPTTEESLTVKLVQAF